MSGNIFLDLCIIMMLIHENKVLELQMATKFKVCDPCGWVFLFIYKMLLINYVVMKKARTGFQP